LQDRLVKELRLRDISTVAEANAWVPSFMAVPTTRVLPSRRRVALTRIGRCAMTRIWSC
jgi:hypothetical protein